MKKPFILIFSLLLFAVAAFFWLRGPVIGQIKGAEMEELIIDGVSYIQNNDTGLSAADRGRFLGRATAGDTTFRIYTVKGDEEGRYVYRLWEWEGAFCERSN